MKKTDSLKSIRMHGNEAYEKLTSLFKTNCFEVLEELQACGGVMNVSEITESCDGISQPEVSQALFHLKLAGVVGAGRVGKMKYYHVKQGVINKINRIAAELAEGFDASIAAELIEGSELDADYSGHGIQYVPKGVKCG